MTDFKRYYITTPIYYVNGAPHCGTATTTLLADATKRYHFLRGDRPYMLTGTDENARKVMEAAAKAGKDTLQFVDEVSQRYVDAWKLLHCDYDVFFRTTEPRHARVVQEVFKRLMATGDIYLGQYEGWYSVADETFFRDTDVDETTQTAKETGAKVERVQEETYFFQLTKYGERLREYIGLNPTFLLPETRRNEVLAMIDQGLRDVAITQNRSGWGIPVPGDAGKVFYVWFDALINYLTETGWPEEGYETLWPADVHLVGKEIYTRFHATLWPAMLFALDLPLPKHVVGHGWWLVRDPATDTMVKGSKSGVPLPLPDEVVTYLQGRCPGASESACVDALRYYLIRDIAFSSDAEFSLEILVSRYNSDLANNLGNVLNRVLGAQYHTGVIPTPRALDESLQALAEIAVTSYEAALERFDWGSALQATWTFLAEVNQYLQEKAPWIAAKKGDTEAVADAVYNALEAIRIAALLASPAMPAITSEIAAQLGLPTLGVAGEWTSATRFGGLVPGSPTGEAKPLFPRIEARKETVPAAVPHAPIREKTKTVSSEPTIEMTAVSDEITIEDFAKIQLRVADIVSAEAIPGAKKLLRLQVRLGETEERQIVSGIADAYAPEDLVGRQIVVVYNLKPAVLRGVESQGMLLAATDAEGKAILLQPDKATAAGAKVK